MKLNGFLSTLIVPAFGFSAPAFACSCMPFGEDFFETVYLHNSKVKTGEWPESAALTVVVAQVSKQPASPTGEQNFGPSEMTVNVIGSLQGNSAAKQLVIKGGDGASCEVPVSTFKETKRYVFALSRNDVGEYYMSLCGNYFKEMASAPKPSSLSQ